MQSESIAKLAEAIAKAQQQLKPVKKECDNPFFKSKYADLASVWEALKPYHEHGIAITQIPLISDKPGHVAIRTQLAHVSGEWMYGDLELPLAKHDPQGVGSAITYARRYALGCMTGVVTEEDDDGNAASQPQPTPAKTYTTNKAAAAKKIAELRTVKQDGAGHAGRQSDTRQGATQQASDAASPLTDEQWESFLDYMADDPDRTNVGKQLKEVLCIGKVADLKGSLRSDFIKQFQDACKDVGVPCEPWVA